MFQQNFEPTVTQTSFYSADSTKLKLIENSIAKEFCEESDVASRDSQVTLIKFNDEKMLQQINKDTIDQQLKKYPLEQRKFLIIDRNNSVIIDTRKETALQQFIKKSSTSTLPTTKFSSANNFVSITQPTFESKRTNWKSSSGIKSSVWQSHWKQSTKVHQQFLKAICQNNFNQFNRFLDKRKMTLPLEINFRSQSNWCPIHYAAMHAGANIMSRLINHPQIDVNALTDFNWTSLHIAVQANKYQNAELLINAGVCIDFRDNENNTALHFAAEFGYKSLIELLIKNGAAQLIKNIKGLIPRELCKSEDLLNLFQKPQDQPSQDVQRFYKLKRNAFVQKMLTTSINNIGGSNLITNEQVNLGFISPFSKNKKNTNNKMKKQQDEKNEIKVKKASQGRKKNIFKMYQLIINNKIQPITLSSFKFYKKIGQGAFGQVYVVKKGKSEKLYALKAIKKQRVIGTALYRYIQTQKEVLSHISHPFIVKLHYAFQTEAYLFLVMDYCQGGDMSRLLEKKQRLDEKVVRMYAAQILLGLQALHKNMIIYRDLKPQNIVLDRQGHACITDFGLSKKTTDLDAINKSFCGTPAYLPLQIINKKGHTRMADWYEFGIVLYELLTGIPPFYAETKTQLYDKVRAGVIRFPKNSSQTFRDLIKKLLAQNPQKRLGFQNDAQSIKQHQWFKNVDWQQVYERRQNVPPLQNKLKIPSDPVKTKFADIKSQKYCIPSWSFVS